MALDTNNNVTVSGFTGEAIIATDYSASEGNHFQVVKLAYGNTADGGTRVTSSAGLPVAVVNTPTVAVSSVAGTVTVTGTVSVNQPVGVTATDLDIRSLTAGDPSTGLATGADFVRVVGLSGAWPVGITATNLGIRALTAGDPTTAGAAGQDVVRIVGYSGGWPIGVTAVDLDIRSLTYGSDSVSVGNTVEVKNSMDPFTASPNANPPAGLNTRVLRASPGANPENSIAAISSQYLNYNGGAGNAEDTVRVVGLSGAWPVNTFAHGLTNINNYNTKVPMHVDSTGALFVNLASGSISVTADISGLGLTLTVGNIAISGVSAANATAANQVLQVHGYTGTGFIPITVTASNLDIRDLSSSTDSVAVTGSVSVSNHPAFTFNGGDLQVLPTGLPAISNNVDTIKTSTSNLSTAFGSTPLTSGGNVKVDIQKIVQPTGGTSGRIAAPSGSATQMGGLSLESGIHFKSDLSNSGVVFVGFNSQVSSQIGFPLYAGDQIFIETNNLNKMFVSSTINGATVYFIGT